MVFFYVDFVETPGRNVPNIGRELICLSKILIKRGVYQLLNSSTPQPLNLKDSTIRMFGSTLPYVFAFPYTLSISFKSSSVLISSIFLSFLHLLILGKRSATLIYACCWQQSLQRQFQKQVRVSRYEPVRIFQLNCV